VLFYSNGEPRNFLNSNARTSLWVVVGLSMGPVIGQGLARFAYALLLPAMRADLGWSYASAGALNTANAAGYLAGALLATSAARRLGMKRAFMTSIIVTAAAVGAAGLTASFVTLTVLRFVAGVCGGIAFVTGGAMAAAIGGSAARSTLALGIYFSGGGLGIAVSALVVPLLLDAVGWRGGWLTLGALAAGAVLIAIPALLRAPIPAAQTRSAGQSWPLRIIGVQLLGYALFGAGYIAYATFIIAHLRTASHFSAVDISIFWALLGLSAIAGGFAWSPLLARLKGGWGGAATIGVVTVGAALPLASAGKPLAYASAILFGGSFLSTITAVTALARRVAPPQAWTKAIAALTVAFGIGQCIGPFLSGYVSDGPDGVRSGLQLSAVILFCGVIVSAFQREQSK
jgi:predicted MFS family arabinose efflux permease